MPSFRFLIIAAFALPGLLPFPAGGMRHAATAEVTVTRSGSRFILRAVDASIPEIARRLSAATGVEIAVDPKLKERTLTISLAPRPADRIIWGIARRLDASAEILYLFKARRQADSERESPWPFAAEKVNLTIPDKVMLEEALQDFGVPARIESGLNKPVRVFSPGIPLYRVLDNLASQVGARWTVEVRIEARPPADGGAGSFERTQRHFSELARFPSEERQEELEAELLRALDSPKALDRIATDIRSLGTLYERFPVEHRGQIAPTFVEIARDYAAVIRRRGESGRDRLAPLATAVHEAQAKFASSR